MGRALATCGRPVDDANFAAHHVAFQRFTDTIWATPAEPAAGGSLGGRQLVQSSNERGENTCADRTSYRPIALLCVRPETRLSLRSHTCEEGEQQNAVKSGRVPGVASH